MLMTLKPGVLLRMMDTGVNAGTGVNLEPFGKLPSKMGMTALVESVCFDGVMLLHIPGGERSCWSCGTAVMAQWWEIVKEPEDANER